jgi:SNF2 family DNA or RNA helicase
MDFCVPGLLGNAKSFALKYQNPLKNEDTDVAELGEEIHRKLGIYLMRRLKKDAAKDLPRKEELKKTNHMPPIQESTYIKEVNSYNSGEQPNMLLTINHIKTISEHPYLYDMSLHTHDTHELIATSARLQTTIEFLDNIQRLDEKVIIFVERKDSQKMIQRICMEKYGIIAKIINGDTPTMVSGRSNNKQSRQTAIDDFQSKQGFNIIIMSPIAAGMGLNVTAANHVVHFSRHWNPAKESQATDRAYRIGQTKDVYVYYPMATSPQFKTFDETLDDLLSRKNSLASSTIFPTERIEVRPDEFEQLFLAK